ncbi:MAG: motility protein A [Leptospiraceae bacterium]|nr:motility protein A [Leptospiraceae bacterium]MDW7975428.1 motility protein A [Leptospiraceae bacterium]
MDIATIVGLIGGALLLLFGMFVSGLSFFDVFDLPSIFITFGGGIAATVIANPFFRIRNLPNFLKFAFIERKVSIVDIMTRFLTLAEKARREGLLSLEDELAEIEDPFMRKGIQLVVDGTDQDQIRNILDNELTAIKNRHAANIKFFSMLGGYLPAFGMIGTLLGLIQMLKNLGTGDASAIGQGMATALITTLYGSIGANLIALPIRDKLLTKDADEILERTVMIEGIIGIQQGENPRVLKDKLASFLAPADRAVLDEVLGQR